MRGDIEAAVSHLGLALRSTASSEAPHLLRATGDAIEALVLQGHQRAAARVLDRYEAQVEELPTRWLRLSLAKARAVAGDPNRADANFGLARAQWAQVDGHFELGRIMLSHAQALLRVARIPDATEQFKRAAAAFTSAGAIGWANRCAELMASTASRTTRWNPRQPDNSWRPSPLMSASLFSACSMANATRTSPAKSTFPCAPLN